MKSHKLLNPQTLKPQKLGSIFLPIQSLCSLTQPDPPPPITHHSLLNSIQTCQWHFIEHLPPNLPSSLISQTLFHLHQTPHLVHQFTSHIDFPRLEIQTQCLAVAILAALPSPKPSLELLKQLLGSGIAPVRDVFDSLARARVRLTAQSGVVLDLLVEDQVQCLRGRVGGAQMIFSAMKGRGVQLDSYTYGLLINGMCKERRLDEASGLFDKMLEIWLLPSAVTYDTLIDRYCNNSDLNRAFGYRDEMVKKGIMPMVSTYNLFIHELFMEGRVSEADCMVQEMEEKGMVPDAITYNILINGYCRSGNAKKASILRDEMLSKGIEPKGLPLENNELQQPPYLDREHHVDLQLLQGPGECTIHWKQFPLCSAQASILVQCEQKSGKRYPIFLVHSSKLAATFCHHQSWR